MGGGKRISCTSVSIAYKCVLYQNLTNNITMILFRCTKLGTGTVPMLFHVPWLCLTQNSYSSQHMVENGKPQAESYIYALSQLRYLRHSCTSGDICTSGAISAALLFNFWHQDIDNGIWRYIIFALSMSSFSKRGFKNGLREDEVKCCHMYDNFQHRSSGLLRIWLEIFIHKKKINTFEKHIWRQLPLEAG